ncbi:MAG: 3-deoxy-7-phosphoheptulonate synthase, partial [Thermoplasmataceae archaeon]
NNAFFTEEYLYSKNIKADKTTVNIGSSIIGGDSIVIAAGPCSVESEDQIFEIAQFMKKNGVNILRGGAFKPRTNPYSFQGLGKEGIRLLHKASETFGIPTVSEMMDSSDFKVFKDNIDLIQIGSRNSQNFSLLKFLSGTHKPILLKNGMGNTVSEWLGSSEYLLSGGNGDVVLCYRGIRSFEDGTRFAHDAGAVPVLRRKTHLPICVDPSHSAGKREYVESIALAAVASGTDMLEIEVHNDPDSALSDSSQQLDLHQFGSLLPKIRKMAEIVRSNRDDR